jgi:hypothetical protein
VSLASRAVWLAALVVVIACGERVPVATPLAEVRTAESSPAIAASASGGPVIPASHNPPAPAAASRSPEPTPALDPVFRAMVDAVAADRPALRLSFTPDRLEGDWRLDGTADDGSGPGRLFIDLTRQAGMLTANPCGDPDFVQGGRCSIQLLATGARLVRRGLVEAKGTRTVVVALIQQNRSGITIEASNFAIAGRAVSVTRPMPLYTVEDLVDLVVAIDTGVAALGAN